MKFSKEDERKYHAVVARAWTDKAYHDRLVKDSQAVLKESGIEMDDHFDWSVKDGATRPRIELALPPRPAGLSDDDIKNSDPDSANTCGCCC